MNIIGIQWGDTATVAAIKNNKVIAAIAEERFTRVKNDMSFPINSIRYCISEFGKEDIDLVTIASKEFDYVSALTHFYSLPISEMIKIQDTYYYPLFYKNKKKNLLSLLKKFWITNQYPKKYWSDIKLSKIKTFSSDVREITSEATGIPNKKILNIEHHKCHANYAYYSSPFIKKKCLIFTIDGGGDRGINATISIGKNGNIKKFYETKNCIVGRIYSHITLLLGMRRLEHEYKIMGLAPYAQHKIDKDVYKVFDDCIKIVGHKFKFKVKPTDSYFYFEKRLKGKRFDIIAAALQEWVENIIQNWVLNTIKEKKINNIVISGGVSMNAKAIGKLLERHEVKNLWVPGAGQDDSICIGAAMEIDQNKNRFFNLNSLYLGTDADLDEGKFIKSLNPKKFKILKYSHIKAARFISEGKVFGRCVGRMEFGPRSLGNRAIIADPRKAEVKQLINRMIKRRDFWMPFAPTILDEYSAKYLKHSKKFKSHHMSATYQTTEIGYNNLKAACHDADKTVRAQILQKDINPIYYTLIKHFSKITKCGALLNTSFNLHGYPVVRTLFDALSVLNKSGLDGIISKNYIVLKKNKKKTNFYS
jgi:carbamoyltransferase